MQFSEVVKINRNMFRHPLNQDLAIFEMAFSTAQFAKGEICVIVVTCSEISVLFGLGFFFPLNRDKIKCVGNFSDW